MARIIENDPEEKLLEPGQPQVLLDDPVHPRVPPPHRASRARIVFIVVGLLVFLAVLFLVGYLPRRNRERGIQREAKEEAIELPVVNVVKVKRSAPNAELLLPGNITPLTEAYIFARSSGYLKKRYVDIGDHVREGQLMAEVEAPDLDQQVVQARASVSQTRAALGQAQASLEQNQSQLRLAGVTLERWRVLVNRGVLSKQEGDQKQADYDNAAALVRVGEANVRAAQDNVRASEANLARLQELQSFEKIRAPFTGIVTARSVDAGSLISANGSGQGTPSFGTVGSGNNNANGSELFRVAQIGVLRILVNVPQSYAPAIRVGMPAVVMLQEFSQRKFAGKVTRTSKSIDQNTRTLLTEVQVQNRDGALLPGSYAQIQFVSGRTNPPFLIPGDSVVVRSKGPQVAVLKEDGTVHFQPVDIGRDYGTDLEITNGLQEGQVVVVNPSDDVKEGVKVQPAKDQQKGNGVAPQASHTSGMSGGQPGGTTDQRPSGVTPPGNAPARSNSGATPNSGASGTGK